MKVIKVVICDVGTKWTTKQAKRTSTNLPKYHPPFLHEEPPDEERDQRCNKKRDA